MCSRRAVRKRARLVGDQVWRKEFDFADYERFRALSGYLRQRAGQVCAPAVIVPPSNDC